MATYNDFEVECDFIDDSLYNAIHNHFKQPKCINKISEGDYLI